MNKSIMMLLIVSLLIVSCDTFGPNPDKFVGKFNVSVVLDEEIVDKKSIKEEISQAIQEAKKELNDAKTEINEEFDLSTIDTFTVEGKIEYAAKQFGKSMTNIGDELGKLGKQLETSISDMTIFGIDAGSSFLKNMKVEVELQKDGDIKTKSSFLSIGTNNAKWEVKNGKFYFTPSEGEEVSEFEIINKKSDGFTLKKDKVSLVFSKIEQ